MEVNLVGQFSREFTFEDTNILNTINDELFVFFNNRYYGDDIKIIYIGIICVSAGFEPFFKVRPPKELKKILAFEYEFKLNFDVFMKASKKEKRFIILAETLMTLTKIFSTKKMNFNKILFISDFEDFIKLHTND